MKQVTTLKQRQALLLALKKRAMTTNQIRAQLGITMPATRVFELKKEGNKIEKEMIEVGTRYGNGKTKVARYSLTEVAA